MSKKDDDWGTPRVLVEKIYEFFDGIPDLDPCTGPTAILKAETMWSVGGLQRPWFADGRRTAFCNPPYSRLDAWMRKCAMEGLATKVWDTNELIALPPASTSAGWWKLYASTANVFAFTKRLNFIGAVGGSARFHSVLPYWGDRVERFKRIFAPTTTWFAVTA